MHEFINFKPSCGECNAGRSPPLFFIADSLFGEKKRKKKAAWEIDNTLILEISLSLEFSWDVFSLSLFSYIPRLFPLPPPLDSFAH